MFKILKNDGSKVKEVFFPQKSKCLINPTSDEADSFSVTEDSMGVNSMLKAVELLLNNDLFWQMIEDKVSIKVMNILISKYNFEPTDKYKEDIENKKQYINQLNEYLDERKEINHAVETELKAFLQETTVNINKALGVFSQGIESRIIEAENRHGIDKIKPLIVVSEGAP